MERREAGEEFPHYDEAEIVVKYHMVDLTQPSSHDAILPTRGVRMLPTLTVLDLKKKIAKVPSSVIVVQCEYLSIRRNWFSKNMVD